MTPAGALSAGAALAFFTGTEKASEPPEHVLRDAGATSEWLQAVARSHGMEATPLETTYGALDRILDSLDCAIVRLDGARFLVVDPGQPRSAKVAARNALCAALEAPALDQIGAFLQRAGIPEEKQERARSAILRERLATARIQGLWHVRLPPSANFRGQLRRAGIPRRLVALTGAHALQYLLWVASWWLIGRSVLTGRGGAGWLLAWGLLLLALVPLRVGITWLQGRIAITAGALLKLRLFFGSLRLHPDSIRHQGAGQLLGRVIESEAVEALALSGGFLALVALVELAISGFVLGAGAGGWLHSILLVVWIAIAGAIGWRFFERNRRWTDVRLGMTHDLVESMVGHRTRLAQLPPGRWHDGEDEALAQYLESSRAMDHATLVLLAVVPRGWLVLALAALAPAFAAGSAGAPRIAIAVGGMLLAYRALRRLTAGAWQLAGAAVAWERIRVLYESARREEAGGSPELIGYARPPEQPVVDAHDLSFRYSDRSTPVLRHCDVRIAPGDRLVLEGASGGGKSTLVSLLIGLREPDSGRLLIDGFDRAALGSTEWRKRIAAAPQFHENHVLAETFAFNLFMGCRRLPGTADFAAAQELCEELGLGEVLERMPAGMLQLVGETGWQLSHGERSRLYIARAILQQPEVIVLDESFAALDPENLRRAVECVTRHAKSLLVIAHR